MNLPVEKISLPASPGLDPVKVYFENYDNGQGRVIIICYDMAWTAYWGAMGERTIQQFFTECDAEYITGNLTSGQHYSRAKYHDAYVRRIVQALHTYLKAERAAA